MLDSGRGCSSRSTARGSPRRCGTPTGTISSLKAFSWAATARRCESSASSSCSSREIPYWRRRFSAVSSIPPGTGWSLPPAVTRDPDQPVLKVEAALRVPQRAWVVKYSTWLMLSAPPAMTRSATPVCTSIAPVSTACSPEPQRRSTWRPGTSTPRPASSAATRPIAGASAFG